MSTRIEMDGGVTVRLFSNIENAKATCETLDDGFKPVKLTHGYVIQNKHETRDDDGSLNQYFAYNREFKAAFDRDVYNNKTKIVGR